MLGNHLVCRTHGLWSLLLSDCKKGRRTKARSCRSVLQCAPINAHSCNQQFTFVDSKTLSEEQREKLFGGISTASDLLGWKTEILSPNDISNAMLQRLLYNPRAQTLSPGCLVATWSSFFVFLSRTKYSLNALSHDAAILLIRKVLADGVKLTEVST